MIKILSIFFVLFLFFAEVTFAIPDANKEHSNELKTGFIHLSQVDPSIIINLKYTQHDNITGSQVDGFIDGKAIVTIETANALREVQEDLTMHGYSLVIYNAYMPTKAYNKFDSWLRDKDSDNRKDYYYPNVTKTALESQGYIKAKLEHTRGSTVDVTIIAIGQQLQKPAKAQKRSYKGYHDIIYLNDGTADMATSYDTMDRLSSFSNKDIPQDSYANRKLLRDTMKNHGFIPNEKFWWQFTLIREPFVDSQFDFDV